MSPTEAERAFLGAVLNGASMHDLADHLQERDFYQPRHGAIWEAMLAVHRAGNRPDRSLVQRALPSGTKVDDLYLLELTSVDVAPWPAQAPSYAEIILEQALARRLVAAADRIKQEATAGEPRVAAENARQLIEEASSHGINEAAGLSAAELVEETIGILESDTESGLSTGWPDLDEDVTLRAGQLAVVGARPSVGKSVIAANLAAAACRAGVGVHFASLEMTRTEVMQRMFSAQASIDLDKIINGPLTDAEWQRLAPHSSKIHQWPLWVDDAPKQTVEQIRARARTTQRRFGLGLVVVDYLQLMGARNSNVPREQQVGEMSEGLKNLAKELRVPIVALSQLNRGSAERSDKRPVMSDLRESGRLEQDADHVWLLHREDAFDPQSATGEMEVFIAKNRNGRNGRIIKFAFQGHYSRVVQLAWSPTKAIA